MNTPRGKKKNLTKDSNLFFMEGFKSQKLNFNGKMFFIVLDEGVDIIRSFLTHGHMLNSTPLFPFMDL